MPSAVDLGVVMVSVITLSLFLLNVVNRYAKNHVCWMLNAIALSVKMQSEVMLHVIIPSVILLSIVMLSVIMLTEVMPSVVAPFFLIKKQLCVDCQNDNYTIWQVDRVASSRNGVAPTSTDQIFWVAILC